MVISTVIIVAVTIALAIAVAYWMGGLATIFTRFEKIEIKNAYVKYNATGYTATLTFVNTGATATSIDSVTLNGVPRTDSGWSPGGSSAIGGNLTTGVTCPIGLSKIGILTFAKGLKDPSGNVLTSGITLTIDIHSTGGKDYYTSVTLP